METELQRSWKLSSSDHGQCSVLFQRTIPVPRRFFLNFVVTEYRLFSRLFSTCWADRRYHHRRPSNHFLHATLSLHHYCMSVTTGGEFRKGNTHRPSKPNHTTNFFARKNAQCRCYEYYLADWLTDSCAHLLHAIPYRKRYVIPNNKMPKLAQNLWI